MSDSDKKSSSVNYPTKLALFVQSAGRCSFPGCNNALVVNGVFIGEAAHMYGESDGGPRPDPNISVAERNSLKNLIALCPNHHTYIDKGDGKHLPIEDLVVWKREVEDWAKDISKSQEKMRDILQITFSKIEEELDLGRAKSAQRLIEAIQTFVALLNDESVSDEVDMLRARTLRRLEKTKDAVAIYESLCLRSPKNARPHVQLAEVEWDMGNKDAAKRHLSVAREIEPNSDVVRVVGLYFDYRSSVEMSDDDLDSFVLPVDKRILSSFYRLRAMISHDKGDYVNAKMWAEKAAYTYASLANFGIKALILKQEAMPMVNLGATVLAIVQVEESIDAIGVEGSRQELFKKFRILEKQQSTNDVKSIEGTIDSIVSLIDDCEFDIQIDALITELLAVFVVNDKQLKALTYYIASADMRPSIKLVKRILIQFLLRNKELTDGALFFEKVDSAEVISFLSQLQDSGDITHAVQWLMHDLDYAAEVFMVAERYRNLRVKIIEQLPDDYENKQKLCLYLAADEGFLDEEKVLEGFHLLDIESLNRHELKRLFKIALQLNLWEYVYKIASNLSLNEQDTYVKADLKNALFNSALHLKNSSGLVKIGREILSDNIILNLFNSENKEIILTNIVLAYIKRGNYADAEEMIDEYGDLLLSFNAKVFVKAELYVKIQKPSEALNVIIDAVLGLKSPNPEQYASLFLLFVHIGNLMPDFNADSLSVVKEDSFVQFTEKNDWYYVGDGESLNLTRISSSSPGYAQYLGKKVGEKIELHNAYSPPHSVGTVKRILNIDGYILAQALDCAQRLTQEQAWDAMSIIDVSSSTGGFDFTNLINVLKKQDERGADFLARYNTSPIPFSLLAVHDGGFTEAYRRVQTDESAFIKATSGSIDEREGQEEIADKIIQGKAFYIDGTTAAILAESGYTEMLCEKLSGMKVPQSVVDLLISLKEKNTSSPGSVGYISLRDDNIHYTRTNDALLLSIKERYDNAIRMYEENPSTIDSISEAAKNKHDIERLALPELSDACILAQLNKAFVFTEDFLYLHANAQYTKKELPRYTSLISVVRVLYKQGKISFVDYLNIFSVLAFNRWRFLPVAPSDLENAVYGDGAIKLFQPEKIHLLNLPLLLSEPYGVAFSDGFMVLNVFFYNAIMRSIASPETAVQLFSVVLNAMPIQWDKKICGRMLLAGLRKNIASTPSVVSGNDMEKIFEALTQFIELYSAGFALLPPIE